MDDVDPQAALLGRIRYWKALGIDRVPVARGEARAAAPEAAAPSPAAADAQPALFQAPSPAPVSEAPLPGPLAEASVLGSGLPEAPEAALEVLRAERLGECTRCGLHATRTSIVFGVGSPRARIMLVGEAPGRDEDLKGEPFVGRAGQLLDKMLAAIKLRREEIYIANVLKCRPPDNRDPSPDEIATCRPFLEAQIDVIRPWFVVTLGNHATKTLLNTKVGITALRGKLQEYRGARLLPTYHPAYLLRNPNMKREAWEDLQLLQREYLKRLACG